MCRLQLISQSLGRTRGDQCQASLKSLFVSSVKARRFGARFLQSTFRMECTGLAGLKSLTNNGSLSQGQSSVVLNAASATAPRDSRPLHPRTSAAESALPSLHQDPGLAAA